MWTISLSAMSWVRWHSASTRWPTEFATCLTWRFRYVANGAVFPYYCRLPSREAIGRASENTIGLINAISIPWFAGLVLFANDDVLLGGKWAPAAGAVRFLAVYGFFLSLIFSALQVLKAVGRTDLVFLGRGLHLATLTVVLVATVQGGITVVALDQALVAAGIAVFVACGRSATLRCRFLALCRSVGLPLLGVVGHDLRRLPGGAHSRSGHEPLMDLPAHPRRARAGRLRRHSAGGYA